MGVPHAPPSARRISWKAGNVAGRVTHEVDADGTHRITVAIPRTIAKWEAPPTHTAPTAFREHPEMTWDEIKPPPRPGAKKT